jgi:hypothetical protein
MHHADVPGATVAALHEAGVAVWVWGVTDDGSIARSVDQGVDGILGDDVAAVVAVVDLSGHATTRADPEREATRAGAPVSVRAPEAGGSEVSSVTKRLRSGR